MLICAPSNSAADLITERIVSASEAFKNEIPTPGIDLTRINSFRRVGEKIPLEVRPYCEDFLIKNEAAGVDISNQLLQICQAKMVVSTCATSGALFRLNMPSQHFTHCIIDEAGYASEPETWIPICAAGSAAKIILGGDPKQLGPVLTSKFADQQGLGTSMIERIMTTIPNYCYNPHIYEAEGGYNPNFVTKLVMNYRSHKDLIHVPSKLFYNNALLACGEDTGLKLI